jgi:hypothetical protein
VFVCLDVTTLQPSQTMVAPFAFGKLIKNSLTRQCARLSFYKFSTKLEQNLLKLEWFSSLYYILKYVFVWMWFYGCRGLLSRCYNCTKTPMVLMVHRHGSQVIVNHQLMQNIIIKEGITNNNFLRIEWYKNPKFNNTSASSSSPIGPVTSWLSLGESSLLHPMPVLMLCKAHAPGLYWNSGYPCPRASPCTKNQFWWISWYNLKLWETVTYKVCFEISQSSVSPGLCSWYH